jgi:hypothetical protein
MRKGIEGLQPRKALDMTKGRDGQATRTLTRGIHCFIAVGLYDTDDHATNVYSRDG